MIAPPTVNILVDILFSKYEIIPGPSLSIFGITPLYSAKKLEIKVILYRCITYIQYSTHPSSRNTNAIVLKVCLYLLGWFTGGGPCILLLATSNGIFELVANVPAASPNKNFPANETE